VTHPPPLLFGSLGASAVAAVVLGAALVVAAVAAIPRRPMRWLQWLCLIAIVADILWLTLWLVFGDAGGTGLNLVPFQEIRRGLDNQTPLGLLNVFGNVLMFVPFGAVVAWLSRRRKKLTATSVGLLLSLAIEVTQLGLGRVGDIDDLILNTAGAFLGGLLAVTWSRIVRTPRADYDGAANPASAGD